MCFTGKMSRITILKNLLKPRLLLHHHRRLESHVTQHVPVRPELKKKLNILFFSNKHNSLSQRMALELTKRKHNVSVHEINDPGEMTELAQDAQPDLILCPISNQNVSQKRCFLIPESLAGSSILESRAIVVQVQSTGHYMTGKMSGV